jgi:hypothetical protein
MISQRKELLLKLEDIFYELRINGLQDSEPPAWVRNYEANAAISQSRFLEWFQFIYLPNCLQTKKPVTASIVPQAMKYFGDDVKKGRLLQLLIELDALI